MAKHKFENGDEYIGMWSNYKMEGYGVFTYSDSFNHKYQGDWQNNKKHGKGKEFFSDGSFFEGLFHEGLKQGQGLYKWKQG